MQQILLITNLMSGTAQSEALTAFTAALNERSRNARYSFCAIQDLTFVVTANGEVSVLYDDVALRDRYAAIHLRNMQKFGDYANALRLYAAAKGLRLINAADASLPYYGKVSQGFLFASNGIPTPALISSASNAMLLRAVEASKPNYPLIVKHNEGIKGLDNFLVHDEAQLREVLTGTKQHYLAQPFIVNSGELRVLTFGDAQKPLVFKKQAVAGTHLNNTSQGGSSSLVDSAELDPRLLADALVAARLTGRDIGGVDVLLANDGTWYVLEVNSTPQIATGAFMAEKIDHYDAFFANEGMSV